MDETNWDDLRLFLAVARGGGLAGAAAAAGLSAPTLQRRMLALERRLGRELFVRHARGYDLTSDGAALLSDLAEVEARIAPLAARPDRTARPVVRISAGTWMTHVLCREVARIAGGGDVSVRFIAADHVLDMRHREAVIGLRNRRPEQIGLAGRMVGRVRFAAYARGPDIATWARVIGTTPSALWTARAVGGAPAIEVTDPRSALDLALAGAARVVLPMLIGERTEGLARVSAPIAELEHEQWLVTHDAARSEPAVRTVIRRIEAILRDVHG